MPDIIITPGNDTGAIQEVVRQINAAGGIGGAAGLTDAPSDGNWYVRKNGAWDYDQGIRTLTNGDGIDATYTGATARTIRNKMYGQRAIKTSVTLSDASPTADVEIPDGNGFYLRFTKNPAELTASAQIVRLSGTVSLTQVTTIFKEDSTIVTVSNTNHSTSSGSGKWIDATNAVAKGAGATGARYFRSVFFGSCESVTTASGGFADQMTINTIFRLYADVA